MSTIKREIKSPVHKVGRKLPLKILIRDYDHLAPLAAGDITPEMIDLDLERDNQTALPVTLKDEQYDGGELSLSHHILRLTANDRSFVGMPNFVNRGFRHRCFFVRRDHNIDGLEGLGGKRIGADKWSTTGNTWQRAALREAGVDLQSITWWVGSIDGKTPPGQKQAQLPGHVQWAEKSLIDMMLEGELDALMIAQPPPGFYDPDGPFVRLVPNFREAEQAYFRRTAIYPGHHIVGVRRRVYEQNPWVLKSLYDALNESRKRAHQNRLRLAETTPWLLAEIEDTNLVLGREWAPDGFEPNREMVEVLIAEQIAQGLSAVPVTSEEVFSEFLEVMRSS
jgi:4,5-dihydroxyphthalate decarboxylase